MRIFLIVLSASLIACSSPAPTFRDHMDADEIYDRLNHQGQRDTVKILRDQLSMQYSNGQRDPGYAIRNPETIVPVWVVGRAHPVTGEKIEGHWKFLVTEEATWAN